MWLKKFDRNDLVRASTMIKIIIDSNVWISFLIGKQLLGLEKLLNDDKFQIITCEEQICELLEVFAKPKLQKYFINEKVSEFFLLLEMKSALIKRVSRIDLCRDAKDNFLLGLANDSTADLLITGDKDLLILNPFGKTLIISFSDFEKQYLDFKNTNR